MASIVTSKMRIQAAQQFLDSFDDPDQNFYLFIGRTLPWDGGDSNPPTPVDCENDEAGAWRTMMSAKLIDSNDVSLVITRNSWTTSTLYTEYQSNIDLFDPTSGNPPFYVITSALNVYKCINNNNAGLSTIQPTGTGTSVVTLSDGYQWKYMFTVNSANVESFVTSQWVPVATLLANDGSNQWLVQQAAIPGTIDRINVTAAGSSYSSIPTVVITGDGSGAAATATIASGNVTGVIVTATGSNYTWATVTFSGGGVGANGAVAAATISPILGHGADPVHELGGYYVIVNTQLIYDENGTFTVSNDYRQLGILRNPLLADDTTLATATDYDQAWRYVFGSISGTIFNADEVVTGSTSGATGVVLDWTSGTSTLRLVEQIGTFIPGETIVGIDASGVLTTITGTAVSGTSSTIVLPGGASGVDGKYTGQTISITSGTGNGQSRIITGYVGLTKTATVSPVFSVSPNNTSVFIIGNITTPDFTIYSGDVLYLENRRPIQRGSGQIERSNILVVF